MKATFFAISTLSIASVASARVVNKARAATADITISSVAPPTQVTATSAVGEPVQATTTLSGEESAKSTGSSSARNGFELDVTTSKLGLKDYYSREDGYIHVVLDKDDALQKATVRSSKDDVTCTVRDSFGYQVRKFGGEHPDTLKVTEFEGQHAYTIGCFFDGEEDTLLASYDKAPSKKETRSESSSRNGFELDITYAKAGLKDFYSRDDGFISQAFLAGDQVTKATVRSVKDDVTCTIKDIYGSQVRKFGGEHPETIELGAYESKMARTVGCFFDGDEEKDNFNYKSPEQ